MWIKFALYFYNLFSVSSLRFKNGQIQVSNLVALSNIIKLPLISIMSLVPVYYKPLRENFYEIEEKTLKNFSTFAIVSMVLTFLTLNIAEFSFCCIQVAKRHEIAVLANILNRNPLNGKFLECFKMSCRRQSLIFLFIYFAMLLSQYLSMTKISLFSLIVSIIFSYPQIVLFALVSALKIYENFVIALLHELENDLKVCFKVNEMTKVQFYNRYQDIFDLVEYFNDTFAYQFTIFSICFFVMSVFNVS